jgi:hypothetical protein
MGVDLYVDPEALEELARQLAQVKRSLEEAGEVPDTYQGRLGSGRIEDAVSDFIGGWKDGRRKIIEGVDGLIGRVEGAIDTYRRQEEEIANAARGGTG